MAGKTGRRETLKTRPASNPSFTGRENREGK
jgi:hypothetical protein